MIVADTRGKRPTSFAVDALLDQRKYRLTSGESSGAAPGTGDVTDALRRAGIRVGFFVDPELEAVRAAREFGATHVELHTGEYCNLPAGALRDRETGRLRRAALAAHESGLVVNGGHGLNYENVNPIVALPHLCELNIGHSVIARAVFVGIAAAVGEMKALLA